MVSDEQRRMKFDMLLAEFNQRFEHVRHEQKLIVSAQSIFIPISYGVLAYTIAQQVEKFEFVLLAAISSVLIYAFQLFLCERISMRLDVNWDRIIEIEQEVSELTGSEFHFSKNHPKKFSEKAESYRPWKAVKVSIFYDWIAFISGIYPIRALRASLLIALILLWGLRLLY